MWWHLTVSEPLLAAWRPGRRAVLRPNPKESVREESTSPALSASEADLYWPELATLAELVAADLEGNREVLPDCDSVWATALPAAGDLGGQLRAADGVRQQARQLQSAAESRFTAALLVADEQINTLQGRLATVEVERDAAQRSAAQLQLELATVTQQAHEAEQRRIAAELASREEVASLQSRLESAESVAAARAEIERALRLEIVEVEQARAETLAQYTAAISRTQDQIRRLQHQLDVAEVARAAGVVRELDLIRERNDQRAELEQVRAEQNARVRAERVGQLADLVGQVRELQGRLQKEAAGRRKAEGALIAAAAQPDSEPHVRQAQQDLLTERRLEQLTRELVATRRLQQYLQARSDRECERLRQENQHLRGLLAAPGLLSSSRDAVPIAFDLTAPASPALPPTG